MYYQCQDGFWQPQWCAYDEVYKKDAKSCEHVNCFENETFYIQEQTSYCVCQEGHWYCGICQDGDIFNVKILNCSIPYSETTHTTNV